MRLERLATDIVPISRQWYLHDALGSTRQTVQGGGTLTAGRYDPWGTPIDNQIAPFGFAGELQGDGGAVSLRARWYTPQQGVFTSRDPFAGFPERPYSQHSFQYGYSNPVRFTDPSGRCVPGIDANCEWREINIPNCIASWVPVIGQSGCEALGNVDDFNDAIVDPVVSVVEPTYDVLTNQPGARDTLRRGADYARQHPEAFVQEVVNGFVAPYSEIYHGIVCQDMTRLSRGLVGFGLMLGSARLARGRTTVPETTLSVLHRLARQADQITPRPPGASPTVVGTLIHTTFARLIRGLNRADLTTEVNYLNGQVVRGNIRGSVRLDVVEGPLNSPIAVYDLKTGTAGLTAQRIAQIRSHLPNNGMLPNGQPIPVIEIRP